MNSIKTNYIIFGKYIFSISIIAIILLTVGQLAFSSIVRAFNDEKKIEISPSRFLGFLIIGFTFIILSSYFENAKFTALITGVYTAIFFSLFLYFYFRI